MSSPRSTPPVMGPGRLPQEAETSQGALRSSGARNRARPPLFKPHWWWSSLRLSPPLSCLQLSDSKARRSAHRRGTVRGRPQRRRRPVRGEVLGAGSRRRGRWRGSTLASPGRPRTAPGTGPRCSLGSRRSNPAHRWVRNGPTLPSLARRGRNGQLASTPSASSDTSSVTAATRLMR